MMIQAMLPHIVQILIVTAVLAGAWLLKDYLFIAMLLLFGIAAIIVIAALAVICSPIIAVFIVLSKPGIKVIVNKDKS